MSQDAVATDVLLSGGGVWVVTGAQGEYSDRRWYSDPEWRYERLASLDSIPGVLLPERAQ